VGHLVNAEMNSFEKILGLKDTGVSARIALICSIICLTIYLVDILDILDRKTQGLINLYLFYPVLIVGLINSMYVLISQIKTKLDPRTLLFASPIPVYVTYLTFRILTT
jgi:hypothetical protein